VSTLLFEHLAEVREEIRTARHLLLGLDFDGTLAPIVPHPADARMPEDTRLIVEALTARSDTTVAVVSGRALADLAPRTGVDAIFAGNHGLEISGRGFEFRHPKAASLQRTLHEICERIRDRLMEIPGSLVEDKGLTATVHLRNVPDSAGDQVRASVECETRSHTREFELRPGKMTLEILPRVSWNKGAGMLWLRDQLKRKLARREKATGLAVCYIGDDVTDEDVFRAMHGITVHVGSGRPTAARFSVDDPCEVTEFLKWLIADSSPAIRS
jgi:trehalose 6-phosphate phosphatase